TINDHLYLQTVAAKSGVYHSRACNGICYQVHLERFAKPGATLLGSDTTSAPAGGADIDRFDSKFEDGGIQCQADNTLLVVNQ
ncbi:unnamed protein product, partial [marine sediment metagenome]